MRQGIRLLFASALITALVGGCPQPTPPPPAPTLTVNLDASLNGDGDIKATTITTAELLDSNTTLIESATIDAGAAVFDLTNVVAGTYSIRINSLNTDLVPTQIDDPTVSITQTVGTTLRPSVIGSLSSPTYRIETFSLGQGEHPVVKYTDGTNIAPAEYAYAIYSLLTSPQRLNIKLLGSNITINTFSPASTIHPGVGNFTQPAGTWLLLVQSPLQHGNAWNGNDANCNTCHGDLNAKAAVFTNITINNGWCFRCHYGKTGDGNGFVNPAQ
jgi:hypothetical protein